MNEPSDFCSAVRHQSWLAGRVSVGALAASAFIMSGCSDGSDSTTGRRILLSTTITAGAEATEPFTNSQGWTIALRKILISIGPLYYFDGAVILSQSESPNRTYELLNRFLGVRSAYAHPGHYVPGNARGQLLNATTVDLHDGPVELAVGEGVTGLVRSATFSFGATPEGSLAGQLGSHVAVVEGTATRDDDTRVFRAELDAADVLNTKKIPAIEGCPFEQTNMQGDGKVTISIRLPEWFDQVEFDTIPAGNGGEATLIPTSSIARNELVRGMKSGEAYVFSYSQKESSAGF